MTTAKTCPAPTHAVHLTIATLALLLLLAPPARAQQPPGETADSSAATEPAVSPAEVKALRERVKQLEHKLGQISETVEESELEQLVKEAEAEAMAPLDESEKPEKRNFLWGALALQKLNPEISVSVDLLAQLIIDGGAFYAGRDDRSSMPIRELSLHFAHVLDPYSRFKVNLNFAPWPDGEADIEEAYITWFGLIPSLSLTVGRFRAQFGQINRWHEHALDQTNYPLAMQAVLGESGINQSGVSVKWFMPPWWAHALELTVEVTDGENETLFAGEFFSVPTALVHLKNYWDLSESTYLELGLTGMWGVNNRRGYVDPDAATPRLSDEDWRNTVVSGADLTLHWSPPQQAKYRSFTWRSEFYYAFKETPDDLIDGERSSWGAYTYVDYQLGTRWFAGARFDAALPTIRTSFDDTDVAWDVVAYATFWQSEFVYFRLEYQHGQNIPFLDEGGALGRRTDNRVLLQIDFAAGPHKHEKY